MTREDVSKLFPEATDEQITKLLNQTNSEIVRERNKTEKYKEDANKAAELQKQLDAIEKQNLSEKELLEKENAKLKADFAELQKANTISEVTSIFAKNGLTGDVYASAIDAFSCFDKDTAIEKATTFANGIAETNKLSLENAKADWEKQGIMTETPNPGSGGKEEKHEDVKSAASEYVKAYNAKMNPTESNTSENAPVNF